MRLIRRIDRGGFGYVEEVETPAGQRLARKFFDPNTKDPGELMTLERRFQREVRIQSALSHPNIMPVMGSALDVSPPWFTMPLASSSFATKLKEDHRGRNFDTAPWPDILAAVEELHRLGYVHRDLKPANILLVESKWVISDFGLILPTMRDTTVLTGSGSAYGSQNYAAPEQATDFRNTPEQADIYALGCILHDAIESAPVRIPFAQIRGTGLYGPVLEKCTEVDYKRRFPSIAALRAALFDLWRTSSFPAPSANDAAILDQLLASPDIPDIWRRFLQHVEGLALGDRDPVLRAMNSEMILKLHTLDDVLFSRLIGLLCPWAAGTSFDWAYTDVVGDRLLDAYKVASVRLRCEIVLCALQMAVRHNRWHVMEQVGGMLGVTADDGLIDRLLIEMSLDSEIERRLRAVERIIHWPRRSWHERIREHLKAKDDTRPRS